MGRPIVLDLVARVTDKPLLAGEQVLEDSLDLSLVLIQHSLFEGKTKEYADFVSEYRKGAYAKNPSVGAKLIKLADDYARGEVHKLFAENEYGCGVEKVDGEVVNQLYGQLLQLALQPEGKVPYAVAREVSAYAIAVLVTNPLFRKRMLNDIQEQTPGEAIAILKAAFEGFNKPKEEKVYVH